MRVNLIGKSNGVGLSRDLELLAQALRSGGCDVQVTAVDSPTSHRRRSRLVQWRIMSGLWFRQRRGNAGQPVFDINIMMEHLWPESLPEARMNIAVPNPEWFDRHDRRLLSSVDRIWAKTSNTQAIFARLGKLTTAIGFDSEDRFDAGVARKREFFHLAGKSTMKGTQRLIQVWRQHPHWPALTVVEHAASGSGGGAANIKFYRDYLGDAELKQLQNANLFHVCTSETEGWGHYIVEAMSVGALAITLDAPPMNELVTAERGLLLPCHAAQVQKLAQCYLFDVDGLAAAVERVMTLSDGELVRYSQAARDWFLRNKIDFNGRIKHALDELDV